MEFEQDGHVTVNVFHVKYPGPIFTADLTALGALVVNWWTTNMITYMGANLNLTKVGMRDLTTAGSLQQDYVTGLPVTGTDAGGPQPNNVALVSTLRSAFAGRSYRGRIYTPGICDDQMTTVNEVSTGFAAAMSTNYGILASDIATAGAALVIASFRTAGAPRASAVLTAVTAISTGLKVDTQRRRLK